MKPPNDEWTEEYLESLIQYRVEENINLDYKACDALDHTDGKKKEITKDVSSFANSDGGIIIYGILEDPENPHLPGTIDKGFLQSEISKEWLEQVINSNISRKIPGLRIFPVELIKSNPNHFVYVVDIPPSKLAPHQARDKRFYKRYNFESSRMEEYEIRDVINRQLSPDLCLEFGLRGHYQSAHKHYFAFKMALKNLAVAPANHAIVTLWVENKISSKHKFIEEETIELPNKAFINTRKYVFYYASTRSPIFGKHSFGFVDEHNPLNKEFRVSLNTNYLDVATTSHVHVKWEIESPGMPVRYGIEQITIAPTLEQNQVAETNAPNLTLSCMNILTAIVSEQ